MITISARAFHFIPTLSLVLLQACGSGAGNADDLQAVDEEVLGADDEHAEDEPNCAIPALCQVCDDGSCATPHVDIIDGECGPVTYTCDGAATGDDGTAGDVPTSSPPNPGPGQATQRNAPEGECPVPAVCQVCDDGSCAAAHVELVDGECGPITYRCDSTPGDNTAGPAVSSPPSVGECPVPAVCQVCDDGSCATAIVDYDDGKCGAVHFVCGAQVEGSPGPDGGVDALVDSGS